MLCFACCAIWQDVLEGVNWASEPPDNTGCSGPIASMEGQAEGATQSSRHTCPSCGKRKGAYCEDCVIVLEQPAPLQMRLPVKVSCAAGRPAAVTTASCHCMSPAARSLPCCPALLVLHNCNPSPPPPPPADRHCSARGDQCAQHGAACRPAGCRRCHPVSACRQQDLAALRSLRAAAARL
jgi:hypothetical protein